MFNRLSGIIKGFVLCLAILSFFILVYIGHSLDDQQRNYLARGGLWPAFEEERHLLLLREHVYRVSLGDVIDLGDYQYRFGVAVTVIENAADFFDETPGISQKQLDTQYQIVSLAEHLKAFHKPNSLPSRENALKMIPLLNEAIEHSHNMVNYRRDETFKDNREMFQHVSRVRLIEIIIVIALILLGASMIYTERRNNKQLLLAQKQIYEANLQRQQMMDRVGELALVEERSRMAGRIHDGLGQCLFSAQLYAAALAKEHPKDERRAALHQVLELAQANLRLAVGALRHDAPEQTLEEILAESFLLSRISGLPVELRADGTPYPVSVHIRYTLKLIVQEALTNALKHSGADTVQVLLDYRDPATLAVTIADNGKGFRDDDVQQAPSERGYGNGLRTMRENAEALGGTFQMTSSETGVRLWVTLPVSM